MENVSEKTGCSRETGEMRTFESVVSEYAKDRKNENIPNSTAEHAYIGIKYLLKNATGKVRILTKSFYPQFWNRLEDNFRVFFASNKNNKVEVITIDDISVNPVACSLYKQYPSQIRFSQLSLPEQLKNAFGSAENFPHFVVIEPIGYRFEVSDKDKENSLVQGIINFGDKVGSDGLTKAFELLQDKATRPVRLAG